MRLPKPEINDMKCDEFHEGVQILRITKVKGKRFIYDLKRDQSTQGLKQRWKFPAPRVQDAVAVVVLPVCPCVS